MKISVEIFLLGVLFTIAYLTIATVGLQNIRIQVNNENLQSPPYLLEALKQASTIDQNAAATAPASISEANLGPAGVNNGSGESRVRSTVQSVSRRGGSSAASAIESTASNGPGFVKEEVIEELLDLRPQSVLRLSPENLIQSVTSLQDSSKSLTLGSGNGEQTNEGASIEPLRDATNGGQQDFQPIQVSSSHEIRRPQSLSVTSSHLKKPAISLSQQEEPALVRIQEQSATIVSNNNGSSSSSEEASNESRVKSRVSPSVAMDDGPAVNLTKNKAPPPPDMWEPSQVMQGVTNVSLVPATMRRQYGQQIRTRITLGGGYTRNKTPSLVNPSADDQVGYKPQEAVAPSAPERPESASIGGDEETNYEPSAGSIMEASRLVEVPKRIVLPASVFKQQVSVDEDSPSNEGNSPKRKFVSNPSSNSTSAPGPVVVQVAIRKRDPRCPAKGLKALGHPTACDMYFLCQDGQLTEHTCPNGLLYGTRDFVRDYCVHRWEADCGDKTIPNPISSPGCRWQNGIFNVQGSPKCTPDFYECKDGQFEVRKCTLGGQVYDDKTKSCKYAELVGCTEEALGDFQCPPDDQTNTYWPFPRYFLNDRALVHCVNDKPQIIRCRDHERVDPENLFCVPINKSLPSDESPPSEPEISARQLNEMTSRKKVVPEPALPVTQAKPPAK